MPCYRPIHAYKGKGQDASKTLVVFKRSESWRGERLDLPCGQCVGCRLERSRQWATRCVHEASMWEKNCFLTLTYNDENLPKDMSLHLDHFQKFMKRLRKRYGSSKENPIRFFHCGEYGDLLSRPHYHSLLFNHDFSDKQLFSVRNGHRIYTSGELSTLWEKGFSVIGEVTFESAAYVARYVMKKITGEKADEHYYGRKPEYITMSRRPGIGSKWFEKFSGDVYPRDKVVVNGAFCRPPRFYDNELQKRDPSLLAQLKIKREGNERFVKDVLTDGRVVVESDSSDRRLIVKEVCKKAEIVNLERSLEAEI